MKIKETFKLVAGSVAVYIAVACSSASGPGLGVLASDAPDDASSPNAMPGTARDTGTTRDTGSSIIDALTDPVPAAMADPNQSGSRLKAKYYAGADGSKTFAGMHDSQLDVDCYFGTAADGMTRCLPSGGPGVGSLFSDSGCSQPIAFGSTASCITSKYVLQATAGSCGTSSTHVYGFSPFTGTAYYGSPSSCTELSADADASALSKAYASSFASYTFYTIGAEIPASSFVQATLQTDP